MLVCPVDEFKSGKRTLQIAIRQLEGVGGEAVDMALHPAATSADDVFDELDGTEAVGHGIKAPKGSGGFDVSLALTPACADFSAGLICFLFGWPGLKHSAVLAVDHLVGHGLEAVASSAVP